MDHIDLQGLRYPLLVGAIIGVVVGLILSQPSRASSSEPAPAATSSSCVLLCERTVWLRTPVRYRAN